MKRAFTVKTEKNEIDELIEILNKHTQNDTVKRILSLLNGLEERKTSIRIAEATSKATESRTAKAKEKIQNAINILRMENKKMTHYSIAKTAGVSYSTVKKYLPDVENMVDRQLRSGAEQK
jgi:Trp operon repressor